MKRSIKQVSPTMIIGAIHVKEDGTKETIKYENPIPFPSADSKEFRKKQTKLYFLNIDDTNCYPLSDRLNDARLEGLNKVTLVEAILDNDNPDYIWCGEQGEVGERSECRKSFCSYYESKSGRGICKHRGNLYTHGEEITFDVPKFEL